MEQLSEGTKMRRLKIVIGLALIPLGVLLGSFLPLGGGSAAIIGGLVGLVLCCVFLSLPTKHAVTGPTAFRTTSQHQDNGGLNQRAIEQATLMAQQTRDFNANYRDRRF